MGFLASTEAAGNEVVIRVGIYRIACKIRGLRLDQTLSALHQLAHADGALPIMVGIVAELTDCAVLVGLVCHAAAGAQSCSPEPHNAGRPGICASCPVSCHWHVTACCNKLEAYPMSSATRLSCAAHRPR